MASRTVNRRPYSVDVSSSEIDYKYFNHVNWKGLCTDKNYFNIDQETFEDCKNVYIDSEGLLKSRPAFKGVEYDFDDTLTECKTFPNHIIVYISSYTGGHTIRVYKDDVFKASVGVGEKYHLLYDHKLFLFTDIKGKEILYYDDEQEKWVNLEREHIEEHIYVPIKTLISNGVRTENEALNTLTDYYRERYIYNDVERITNPPYVNRQVNIIADGKTRGVYFVPGTENTIFLPKFSVNDNNWYDGELLLETSENGDVILSSSVKTIKDDNNTDINDWTITYSFDGRIFRDVPSPTFEIFGKPILSVDGSFVVVFGSDGPYAYSLLADNDGVKTFYNWTNLLTYNNQSVILESLGQVISGDSLPVDNTFRCVNGVFKSPDTFMYSYGFVAHFQNGLLCYNKIQHVTMLGGVYNSYNYDGSDYNKYDDELPYLIKNVKPNCILHYYSDKKMFEPLTTYIVLYRANEQGVVLNAGQLATAIIRKNVTRYYSRSLTVDGSALYNVVHITASRLTDSLRFSVIGSKLTYSNSDINLNLQPSLIYVEIPFSYYLDVGTIRTIIPFVDEFGTLDRYGNVLSNNKYYIVNDKNVTDSITLPQEYSYVKSLDAEYAISNNIVYSNKIGKDIVNVDVLFDEGNARLNVFVPSHSIKSNVWYLSVGNDLYTSSYKEENDKFKLYIPRSTKQPFDYPITNLHPVSESQVAIFFENEIWYTVTSEYGQEYYKSKLNVGLREGSNVINSIDGKNIIFSSTEGLVYLSYEQLVQSTEQTLTYLSDIIYELYKEYNKDFVKLYLHKYWLYCYNTKSLEFFIFDIRNNSWWKWEYRYPIMNIIVIDNDLRFINDAGGNSNPIVNLSNDINEYYDYGNYGEGERKIDWFFTSQKLHLSSLNYYKNIASIIINNVEPENIDENVSYNLNVKNYRLSISDRYEDVKTMDYVVNMLRTYVKRCNSRKVNQFQYTISSNDENAIQLPLSIHSIIVKYSMGGHVR